MAVISGLEASVFSEAPLNLCSLGSIAARKTDLLVHVLWEFSWEASR